MYILIVILIIIIGLLVILNINENFQTDTSNGYVKACNEINAKRLILKEYMRNLRGKVQDLSGALLSGVGVKKENMMYQYNLLDDCTKNLNQTCINLASVDAGVFEMLPDVDIFYYNLLSGEFDIQTVLDQLNLYRDILNCPKVNGSQATFDSSDNEVDIERDIGEIDTEVLAYELESLSPYYLSPDVVKFLLRFLISKEQLNNLKYTSADYVKQERELMTMVKGYYI
jgi:hypothetical protein